MPNGTSAPGKVSPPPYGAPFCTPVPVNGSTALARFAVGEEDKVLAFCARTLVVGKNGPTASSIASKDITITDGSFLLRMCIIAVSYLLEFVYYMGKYVQAHNLQRTVSNKRKNGLLSPPFHL